jgi:preprotein translocase subunit SecG
MSMNLLEPTVWVLVLGVFVCVLVLGLFNHLRDQPERQCRERPRE